MTECSKSFVHANCRVIAFHLACSCALQSAQIQQLSMHIYTNGEWPEFCSASRRCIHSLHRHCIVKFAFERHIIQCRDLNMHSFHTATALFDSLAESRWNCEVSSGWHNVPSINYFHWNQFYLVASKSYESLVACIFHVKKIFPTRFN